MEPPPESDGERVLHFASLSGAQPSKTRHVVNGVEVTEFAALAIVRTDAEPHCVSLYYCDSDWNVITDSWHEDVVSALDQANWEFGPLQFHEVGPSE
jgi:hypothetical protein